MGRGRGEAEAEAEEEARPEGPCFWSGLGTGTVTGCDWLQRELPSNFPARDPSNATNKFVTNHRVPRYRLATDAGARHRRHRAQSPNPPPLQRCAGAAAGT